MLTDDVVNRVLDLFAFEDLRPVLAVCKQWRHLALQHPSYWADISLRGTSPGAVELFKVLLARSGTRRIRLTIIIPEPWELFSDIILPAFATHLSHVGTLELKLPASHMTASLNALRRPAPIITRLLLHAFIDSADLSLNATMPPPYPILPVDVFCNNAPSLRHLTAANVTLPPVVVPALSAVTEFMTAFFEQVDEMPLPNVFLYFPQLHTLAIGGSAILYDPAYWDRRNWDNLCCLLLNTFYECNQYILTCLPVDKLPLIHAAYCENDQPDLLIRHLDGPLSVTFADRERDNPTLFLINMTAQRNGMTRTFTELWPDWSDRPPHNLFERVDISQRIVSLTIPDTIWSRVANLHLSLPGVIELRLHLHNNEFSVPLTECSLTVPKLRTLVLRSDIDSAFARPALLVDLVQSAVSQVAYPISLALENVFVDSGRSMLRDFFDPITHQALDLWRYPAPRTFTSKG
ncbi:hypothetical protein EXIGLDRAFT_720487 [Exidia glandulosa HHB12029]|uniref:Uncharacterized protein n=1 Tax=Exidia glandulosa HHB12029 TaxID=1314781 RepID=A0A165GCZ9_EXIGL|nr:hypothetical protein EXIGLDRAFT_720487 [Exidia glandulosa HHB12029]